MADPLSVTASIIAVVGVAHEVTKGLRRLKAAKDAPEDLKDLLENLVQLEMVLNGIKSGVLSPGSPPVELASLIEEAGSKLLELRSLIEYTLTKAGVSDKVDRWQWLRKGNEVERLRNQLSAICLNLVALTSSANFGVLQRVSIVTQDLSCEQQRLNAQMTSVLPRQEALLNNLCQRIEESQATQAAMMRLLGNFRQTNIDSASDNAAALSEGLESEAIRPIVARPRMRSRSEFHIQKSQFQSACPLACTCNCHEFWKIYAPRKLRKLFGHSKIEGAGLPNVKGACSLRSCKGKGATFIHINFFLPTMMAARMISLWFTSSPSYGPELLLRVPRVVRTDSPAFRAICSGDLDTVKRSISAGDYRPWDVDHTGQSLILMAFGYRRFTTALYLAQVAADNYECLREDCSLDWYDFFSRKGKKYTLIRPSIKRTAISRLIFVLTLDREEGCPLWEVDIVPGVDWDELSNMNGFSKLHKIVYGITSQSLEAEIDARPEDLDRPDSMGLTALWYACWLGNSNYIRILIDHGANINNAGIPPICAAVWRGRYDSVEQLLNAGAFVNDRSIDMLYQTLMYRPSCPGENVEEVLAIDKALFRRFVDINYRPSTCGLPTPLIALALGRSSHMLPRMEQLLELGAHTELCDERGLTPLHHAISVGNVEGCKILGRAGANPNVQTKQGCTILHTAIMTANHAGIIQTVSELDLSGVELGAKDDSGCTAFEHLKIRAGGRRDDHNIFPGCLPSRIFGMPRWSFDQGYLLDCPIASIDTELQILSSFQNLLQQVQEAQGIPVEDRYPLFSLTRESIMVDHNENMLLETDMPVMPGAWPDE